jgi:hypothetical protein
MKGVQSVIPDAKFFGPEADSGVTLDRYLSYMQSIGLKIDIPTTHDYSWDAANNYSIEDAVRRHRDEFGPVLARLAPDDERWISEWGDRGKAPDGTPLHRHVEFFRQVLVGNNSNTTRVLLHDWDKLFKPKTDYEPSAFFFEMQRYVSGGAL